MKNVAYPILLIRRKERQLSQKEVGNILGLSRVSYGMKEAGKVGFTLEESKKLSELFGLSIDNLMYGKVEEFLKQEI